MLGLLLAGVLTAGGYDGGTLLCRLTDPAIAESSGLVSSSTSDDVLYTHNDSGDTARFFALDRSCRRRATFLLSGVQARDWEDISRGPGHTLWLGDIGDNSGRRRLGILVHRVAEPSPTAVGEVRLQAVSYRLRYPDGPHDAEALLVHPRTGQLLVVTKDLAGGIVYAAPSPLRPGQPNVLARVGRVGLGEVTAGDISPDGSRLVLRNYVTAYEWDVAGNDVMGALRRPPAEVALPAAPQGEAISYSRDGRSLLTSSEGVGTPVFELHRVRGSQVATAAHRRSWVPGAAGGLLALVALVALAARRRHRVAR